MKEIGTDDPLFGEGPLRVDGRRLIPAYLFEVKKPEESKYPWDYYKLVATIAPEDAAKPLSQSPIARWRRSSALLFRDEPLRRRPGIHGAAGNDKENGFSGAQ